MSAILKLVNSLFIDRTPEESKKVTEKAVLLNKTLHHKITIFEVALNMKGMFGLFSSDDYTVRLWDLKTGKCLETPICNQNKVGMIVISANGKIVLFKNNDKLFGIWDIQKRQCLRNLEGHKDISCMTLNEKGDRALSGSLDKLLRFWDLKTGTCLNLPEHKGDILDVALNAEGNIGLSGSSDNSLYVWNIKKKECLKTLCGHTSGVSCVAMSADGNLALSGSSDKTLRLWDVKTGECLRVLSGHDNGITKIALGTEGLAMSVSNDKSLRIWDIITGECLKSFSNFPSADPLSIQIQDNNCYVLLGSKDGVLDCRCVYSAPKANSKNAKTLQEKIFDSRKAPTLSQPLPILISDNQDSRIAIIDEFHRGLDEDDEFQELQAQKLIDTGHSSLLSSVVEAKVEAEKVEMRYEVEVEASNRQKKSIDKIAMPKASKKAQTTSATSTIINSRTLNEGQIRFLSELQGSGFNPSELKKLQENSGYALSPEEQQYLYSTLQKFNSKMQVLEQQLTQSNRFLGLDPETLKKQTRINKSPKLIEYQCRLEQELSRFILCYQLASTGIFQMADNKKAMAINLIANFPGGIFLKVFTESLLLANKKNQLYQFNHVGDLFKTPDHISKIVSRFALLATELQAEKIEAQELIEYEGLANMAKGFFKIVYDMLKHEWRDLKFSDKTGINVGPSGQMAVMDVAYLLQKLLSNTFKIDRTKDLEPQFIEALTGKPYHTVAPNTSDMNQVPASNPIPVCEKAFTACSVNSTVPAPVATIDTSVTNAQQTRMAAFVPGIPDITHIDLIAAVKKLQAQLNEEVERNKRLEQTTQELKRMIETNADINGNGPQTMSMMASSSNTNASTASMNEQMLCMLDIRVKRLEISSSVKNESVANKNDEDLIERESHNSNEALRKKLLEHHYQEKSKQPPVGKQYKSLV